MCTQEIVWCSCGHGELLPIVKCDRADVTGVCFTVVHGDHRIVVHMQCSYCLTGPSERTTLGTKARPEGELAATIEKTNEGESEDAKPEMRPSASKAREAPLDVIDVSDWDWCDLGVEPELWQYV